MPRTTKLVIAAAVMACVAPLSVVTYYGGVQHYTLADSLYSALLGWAMDTDWAAGYSEAKFSKINLGMTQDEVRKIMGEPIWMPNTNYWGYTWSPSSTHYHQRGVEFSPSGRVTHIVKGFYFD
jgi:outer membrane protein assembly factor BamE (lipoprotein component of BamABCDE complex)